MLTASLQKGPASDESEHLQTPLPQPQLQQQPLHPIPTIPPLQPAADDALLAHDSSMEYKSSSTQYALTAATANGSTLALPFLMMTSATTSTPQPLGREGLLTCSLSRFHRGLCFLVGAPVPLASTQSIAVLTFAFQSW
jgi:hypothetical protein